MFCLPHNIGPVRLNLSVMVQCFSLTINQWVVLFSLAFQRGEQGFLYRVWFPSSHALPTLSHSSTLRHPARLCLVDLSFPRDAGRRDARMVQGPMYHALKTQNCDTCLQLNKISSRTGPVTKTTKYDRVYRIV